jgi:hypothetical protein
VLGISAIGALNTFFPTLSTSTTAFLLNGLPDSGSVFSVVAFVVDSSSSDDSPKSQNERLFSSTGLETSLT